MSGRSGGSEQTASGGGEQEFYERYVAEHVPYQLSPHGLKRAVLSWLPYWSYREWRFWRRWTPRGCRLLDLGCARGREVFAEQAASVVGIDLARNALADCRRRYGAAAEGSLTALPFPDAAFDCVVSSHVFGHIRPELKDAALAEMRRVLRPGGSCLHVIETDSSHPLIALAKTRPELYRRHLIEQDGHVGLELPSRALERFARAGFELEALEKMDPGRLHPRLTLKWFDNEFSKTEARFAELTRRAKRVLESPVRLAATEIALGFEHRGSAQAAPLDQAIFVAGAWRLRDPAA